MRKERLRQAGRRAETLLAELTRETLPVDPLELAKHFEIEVVAKAGTTAGVSGMLLHHGDEFCIVYATHIPNEGFQRFSIAHELGHYCLDGHPEHLFPDGDGRHESRAGFISADVYELEADHFAAGLLMPSAPFCRVLATCTDGLATVEKLAELCKTSLTSTAIRCAQKTAASVAVVLSTGPTVDYCIMSDSLKEFDDLKWLRKGEPLPAGSETQRFNTTRDNVLRGRRATGEVDLRHWFGGRRALPGLEEVAGLGGYGKTLTVLTTDVLPDDEDEEADLEESWTVRFRR